MATGIMIIIFVALHIVGYSINPMGTESTFYFSVYHFIVDNMLFFSIAMHLRISIPKFMMSLGFLDGKDAYANFKRKTNYVVLIILIILVLAEVTYYIGGILW